MYEKLKKQRDTFLSAAEKASDSKMKKLWNDRAKETENLMNSCSIKITKPKTKLFGRRK